MEDPPIQLSQAMEKTGPVFDASGRLESSTTCRSCGYLLRGLRASDSCPECAMSVGESIRGDELRYADHRWVRKLALGCRWYVIGSILTMLVLIGLTTAAAIAAAIGGPTSPILGDYQLIAGLAGFPTAIITIIGAWLLTTPDPAAADQSGLSIRTLARAGLIAHAVSAPTQMYWSGASGATTVAPVFQFIAMAGLLAGLLSLVGWLLYFLHVGRLARRLPAPKLAGQLRLIAYGYAAWSLLLSVGGVGTMMLLPGMTAGGQVNPTGWSLAIIGTACCSTLLFFAFEIWAIIVHLILGVRFKACIAGR